MNPFAKGVSQSGPCTGDEVHRVGRGRRADGDDAGKPWLLETSLAGKFRDQFPPLLAPGDDPRSEPSASAIGGG